MPLEPNNITAEHRINEPLLLHKVPSDATLVLVVDIDGSTLPRLQDVADLQGLRRATLNWA
jgi:hypothetical protein